MGEVRGDALCELWIKANTGRGGSHDKFDPNDYGPVVRGGRHVDDSHATSQATKVRRRDPAA